jgi:hypothetical protein
VQHDGDEFSDGGASAPFAQAVTKVVSCKADPTVYSESKTDSVRNVAFTQSRQVVSTLLCGEKRRRVERERVAYAKSAGQRAALTALREPSSVCRAINAGYAEYERQGGGATDNTGITPAMVDALATKCADVYCSAVLKYDASAAARPRANYSALATLYALREGVPGLYPAVPVCQLLPNLKHLEKYGFKIPHYTMARKACSLAFSALVKQQKPTTKRLAVLCDHK